MTVKDVMTAPVAACRADTNVAEVCSLMWNNNCGSVPVLNRDGGLIGIVTDRDICIALGTRNMRPSDLRVVDVMREHVVVCNASDDVHLALHRMAEEKIRRLPVINEEGYLEGIVSMDDMVLKAKQRGRNGSTVSFVDAVTTLQAIYAHPSLEEQPTVA